MEVFDKARGQPAMTTSTQKLSTGDGRLSSQPEASFLYALLTSKRSVSRRNRASWYLRQLNKIVKCDPLDVIERDEAVDVQADEAPHHDHEHDQILPDNSCRDIYLVSMLTSAVDAQDNLEAGTIHQQRKNSTHIEDTQRVLVTPNTRILYLSQSIATSIILDLSPSVVSVSPQNDCVLLDSMFDSLKSSLQLLVKEHLLPPSHDSKPFKLAPRVFVSVIAYTPFVVAKGKQVLIQNRRISHFNIEQVLIELYISLNKLIQELHELVTSTCGYGYEYGSNKILNNAFTFTSPLNNAIIRHPGSVLDDIYELGLFSSSLMPRLSRRSIVIITDGLFASSNNLSTFRLKNIAVSFVSLATESIYPNACFGYTAYNDLMKFVAKSTQGVYISKVNLIDASNYLSKVKDTSLMSNPLHRLFGWTIHSDLGWDDSQCPTPKMEKDISLVSTSTLTSTTNSEPMIEMKPEYIAKLFCIDQPVDAIQTAAPTNPIEQSVDIELVSNQNYHDWRSFRPLGRSLDADFEQVLSCLLREGYLIKSIQLKHRETSTIVARLVLYWKHNLNLEQELQAPYWNSADPFNFGDSNNFIMKPFLAPSYGDTYCEVIVHGSYNFLHDFYCDKKQKRRSDYRAIAYQQFEQLTKGVKQTYDKLQYLSRYYRDPNISNVPSFLLHGNSLLFEQPHTRNITSTIDNVVDKSRQSREFSDYWQEMSKLELRTWKNIMHVHTLRLILDHDQPKYKNLHCQNANGRYTHIQCRRTMSAISNFIRGYASFALLEDSIYIRFIHNKEDDLCDLETSATKGFVVIKVKKLLPIVVIYLMFTSGILDSHRAQIVDHLENQLINCRLRTSRTSNSQSNSNTSTLNSTGINILKSKIIYSSSESCCVLIRSPLERMLRIYSRNMINEILAQNIAHGLPGSCSLSTPQDSYVSSKRSLNRRSGAGHQSSTHDGTDTYRLTGVKGDQLEEYSVVNNLAPDNRYNLVFGKYLYGVRVVHAINNLPHSLAHHLVNEVLVKISAILMNVRIKQGFHIAFNNSGLLTLVSELKLGDSSQDSHNSNCLCQYLVFPPTVTSCCPQNPNVPSLETGQNIETMTCVDSRRGPNSEDVEVGIAVDVSSKPNSVCGSLGDSDHKFMKDQNISAGNNQNAEVKIVREYWIEPQHGTSIKSERHHRSLENKRFSEIVDHLYLTDTTIFDCLFTYDLLQLLCDKMSPFYNVDTCLSLSEPRNGPLFSPTDSTSSSHTLDQNSPLIPSLPSSMIEGTQKDGAPRLPIMEIDYQFSVLKFLDYCQFASLDVVLFRERSEFYEPPITERECDVSSDTTNNDSKHQASTTSSDGYNNQKTIGLKRIMRRVSVDVNDSEVDSTRTNHRSSHDNLNNFALSNLPSSSGHSLNLSFMEILYKRLKQIHDKELQLSDYDKKLLTDYLKRRKIVLEYDGDDQTGTETQKKFVSDEDLSEDATESTSTRIHACMNRDSSLLAQSVNWRCFMRKGNQENLMIVLIPHSLEDVYNWMRASQTGGDGDNKAQFSVCPMFVFRCSNAMIANQVLSFLSDEDDLNLRPDDPNCPRQGKSGLEVDLSLHFGQPCLYFNRLRPINDELDNEILPESKFDELSQGISDEKTQELIHFRAFLRKIKNTVLKSRFSSLNEAYLSETFVHKDDILYYVNNVKSEIQKKYHVSTNLRILADFIQSYEDYHNMQPEEIGKECNQLLNSILLQKCGLFINQPLARFDESNPLMKQLYDRKLLFLMRCNYKIELPIIEDTLANSKFLKVFLREPSRERSRQSSHNFNNHPQQRLSMIQRQQQSATHITGLNSGADGSPISSVGYQASSLGRQNYQGSRSIEVKCGSMGNTSFMNTGSSPSESSFSIYSGTMKSGLSTQQLVHERANNTTDYVLPTLGNKSDPILTPSNDSFFLEAFKGYICSIDDMMPLDTEAIRDVALRHEAHMAEALKRKCERKESHHYRRVLRSKGYHSQSHSAINQALKKVDSLGRLEHFCLTPLLFSPAWRSKLAPVRDHTVTTTNQDPNQTEQQFHYMNSRNRGSSGPRDDEANERWHNLICNNYIKEYEQYIQTLGFNSVQIRFPASSKLQTSMSSSSGFSSMGQQQSSSKSSSARKTSLTASTRLSSNRSRQVSTMTYSRRDSSTIAPSASFIPINSSSQMGITRETSATNSYLIKFLNSGCLVFKVGFCKPYVYSILYSIEGERFNNSNTKMNMSVFLDELDSIKVTLHLHSFTYDYHLRSMYSYISRRLISFDPGYHLISFADDFRKYYQKAPNYARNQILTGDLDITGLNVKGQDLYNYIITHNTTYQLEVLEMSNTTVSDLTIAGSSANGGSKAQRTTRQMASFLSSQFGSSKDSTLKGAEYGIEELVDQVDVGQVPTRNHANDYVLVQLKREKVRHKDGKDPDIFDCGLIIAHDYERTKESKNSLCLRYFLILTNQRDLYPKLLHTGDPIISLGCHRPIRLGVANQIFGETSKLDVHTTTQQPKTIYAAPDSDDAALGESSPIPGVSGVVCAAIQTATADSNDARSGSELLSSGEFSDPQSILSSVNSIQSSQSNGFTQKDKRLFQTRTALPEVTSSIASSGPKVQLDSSSLDSQIKTEEAAEALVADELLGAGNKNRPLTESGKSSLELDYKPSSSVSEVAANENRDDITDPVDATTANTATNDLCRIKTDDGALLEQQTAQEPKETTLQKQTICDEEITYLGYFSTDEMDMLKFLQEKTASLQKHLEQIFHQAETHLRRDYLWHKLMQRQSSTDSNNPILGSRSSSIQDQLPLSTDELLQLLSFVEAIDLSILDPNLATFSTMHIGWYLKLLSNLSEFKQSQAGFCHRFHIVKASKVLLLYIDPRCTTAFVLLSIAAERGSVELSMLMKDKRECRNQIGSKMEQPATTNNKTSEEDESSKSPVIDLDADCRQLISDFINFCATFMWSNLLT